MEKFLRNYLLSVQTREKDELQIKPPFTLDFDVQRDLYGRANPFTLRVYNLGKQKRNALLKDFVSDDWTRLVNLRAGYGNGPNFPTILFGNINQCTSVREGTNYITTISGQDGATAYAQAMFDKEFPSGTPLQVIIDTITTSLGQFGIKKGVIGQYEGSIPRGVSYSGNPMTLLKEITGATVFIDNGIINVLRDDEYIAEDEVATIDASSGLLNTPRREETLLHFEMIFEPKITAGSNIILKSTTMEKYNGFGKVLSVHHKGTISDSMAGSATTTITVNYGDKGLVPVYKA